ncbi:MAG: hypothetical protein PHQ03_02480 [Methylococcales bacterium]|nr:hypothetical protein [Methylococcales bacterium]
MSFRKKSLVLSIGLSLPLVAQNFATAAVWQSSVGAIPSSSIVDGKVAICHATGSASNPFTKIEISLSGLNGHDGHPQDEFLNVVSNLCGTTGLSPDIDGNDTTSSGSTSKDSKPEESKESKDSKEAKDSKPEDKKTTNCQPASNDTKSDDNKDTKSGDNKDTKSGENKDTKSGENKDTKSDDNKDTKSDDNKDTKSDDNKDTKSDVATECLQPTVNTITTSNPKPTITGTVGQLALTGTETFTVKVSNAQHLNDISGILQKDGLNWTYTVLTELNKGTYNVDAVRNNTIKDKTDGELIFNEDVKIDICENGANIQIDPKEFQNKAEGKNHYLGKCKDSNTPICTNPPTNTVPVGCIAPLPTKEDALPNQPAAKVNEAINVSGLQYCEDGGVLSDTSATGVTIKRATIKNATTQNGTVDLFLMPVKVKYGVKVKEIGTMSIGTVVLPVGNVATGVTLTGVTLEDAYLDTDVDFVDGFGNLVAGGTHIKVTGGVTNPTTTKNDGSITRATITNGMIIAGNDAQGNPVRGSVTTGTYASDIVHNASVVTKGRRTHGTLVDATIQNAKTTTVDGVTVISAGTVTAGQIQNPATFGTVENATLTNATLSSSNHCFSSGTVGLKGQLNWKEVVK